MSSPKSGAQPTFPWATYPALFTAKDDVQLTSATAIPFASNGQIRFPRLSHSFWVLRSPDPGRQLLQRTIRAQIQLPSRVVEVAMSFIFIIVSRFTFTHHRREFERDFIGGAVLPCKDYLRSAAGFSEQERTLLGNLHLVVTIKAMEDSTLRGLVKAHTASPSGAFEGRISHFSITGDTVYEMEVYAIKYPSGSRPRGTPRPEDLQPGIPVSLQVLAGEDDDSQGLSDTALTRANSHLVQATPKFWTTMETEVARTSQLPRALVQVCQTGQHCELLVEGRFGGLPGPSTRTLLMELRVVRARQHGEEQQQRRMGRSPRGARPLAEVVLKTPPDSPRAKPGPPPAAAAAVMNDDAEPLRTSASPSRKRKASEPTAAKPRLLPQAELSTPVRSGRSAQHRGPLSLRLMPKATRNNMARRLFVEDADHSASASSSAEPASDGDCSEDYEAPQKTRSALQPAASLARRAIVAPHGGKVAPSQVLFLQPQSVSGAEDLRPTKRQRMAAAVMTTLLPREAKPLDWLLSGGGGSGPWRALPPKSRPASAASADDTVHGEELSFTRLRGRADTSADVSEAGADCSSRSSTCPTPPLLEEMPEADCSRDNLAVRPHFPLNQALVGRGFSQASTSADRSMDLLGKVLMSSSPHSGADLWDRMQVAPDLLARSWSGPTGLAPVCTESLGWV